MTKEEKKAIEIVKEIWQFTDYSTDKIALKVVLDLLEKLQKENLLLSAKENMSAYFEFKRNYISKDKIREKIKDLQKDYNNDVFIGYEKITGEAIKKLKQLLEEEK